MKFADAIRQPDPAMVSLIQSGYYMKNIRNLMKHFPRNQIHIMISERLRQNAEAEYLKLLTFLNLKPSDHPFENKHERQYAEPMAPHMRQMLERHYRPSNLDLMEFLNDPIPEWDES